VGDPQPERRKTPRTRTLKSACIVFNDRRSVVDCTVRNLSANGALLLLPSIVGIPNDFEVFLGDRYRSARVVWKSDKSVGIAWGE
jgi:hypothetical protein